MTHLSEEDLILLYYAEPGAAPGAAGHLEGCAMCREAAAALRRDLAVCNEMAAPERGAEFGREAWNRLAPVLEDHKERSGWRPWMAWRPVQMALGTAAMAALLFSVFVAGRYSRKGEAPEMAGLSDQARDRILAIAVADHLDRVQRLITEIADDTSTNGEMLAATRARAEDLLGEDRLMRQSLAAKGETATTGFLDEVEPFLTEAAHTKDAMKADALRELRARMDADALLFKVRVVEANLRGAAEADGEKKEERL